MIENIHLVDVVRALRNKITPPLGSYLKNELHNCHSVLDFGCGNNSPIFPNNYESLYIGVDIYWPAIMKAKDAMKNTHAQYILGDLTQVQFRDKSFDGVVCLAVLEHLPKEKAVYLIHKMKKLARKKIRFLAVSSGCDWGKNPPRG